MSLVLNLDLISLRMFVLVCEAGSLTRVAQTEALVVSAIVTIVRNRSSVIGRSWSPRSHARTISAVTSVRVAPSRRRAVR